MSGFEFTDKELVSALRRSGFEVLTLDNLDEWPEPDRSRMKAGIAAMSQKLADSIEDDCLKHMLEAAKQEPK